MAPHSVPRAKSSLSYSISRPYPYRWFTPVAVAVLLAFTALFSFFNFLITGYTPQVRTSTNPNATEAENPWLRSWPSYIFNVKPRCQSKNLPVGSVFFTNQTALTYTLAAVWQQNSSGIDVLSSLPYFNNVLENCEVTSIDIDIEAYDRNAAQIAYNMYGEIVRSYVQCTVQSPNGLVMFNLTQTYDYIPPDISMAFSDPSFLGTNFLERNNETKASLWWGETLMSTYWSVVSGAMEKMPYYSSSCGSERIRKGTLYFARRHQPDITQTDFFKVDFRYLGDADCAWIYPGTYDYDVNGDDGIAMLTRKRAYPNIWAFADMLAKSAYSTVLADLGQSTFTSNIVTDPDLLQQSSAILMDMPFIANARPGPATEDYESLKDFIGPLGMTPSTISTEYICEVPKRKSTGNLVISILVADIVLINVVWQILNWIVVTFFLRRYPTAQYCEGCIAALRGAHEDYGVFREESQKGGEKQTAYTRVTLRSSSLDRCENEEQEDLRMTPAFSSGRDSP